MAKRVDVAIVGSGSAGLCAALCLAKYQIHCKIFERNSGPLRLAHADGVQCRTVEIFESFGLGDKLLAESEHVVEVMFWSSEGSESGIRRVGRTPDPPPGLSHQPHVVLSQARVNEMMIEEMRKLHKQEVDYSSNVLDVQIDKDTAKAVDSYPVSVVVDRLGVKETYQARYVLACDGAHSQVRHSLGIKMIGDSTDAVWGVMDVIVRTSFPDIRKKTIMRTPQGTLMIIPREEPDMVRFYVELPHGVHAKEVVFEQLLDTARQVIKPYSLDVETTIWWSAYSIGQRLANSMEQDHHVFLTGDACHTHSPKAGQGMNTSLQDGYNIGWKLGEVLSGQAKPTLLKTYVTERYKTASELIEFDRSFAKMFASDVEDAVTASQFEEGFKKSGQFTTGLSATYSGSTITVPSTKALSKVIIPGMRMPSAQVVRLADSRPFQLLNRLPSDGKWRLIIFGGQPESIGKINKLGESLTARDGPLAAYTPQHTSADSLIDTVVVMYGDRTKIEFDQLHKVFWPAAGERRLNDLSKIYVDDESYHQGHGRAYEKYGIDPTVGCVVIVRPDQYVSGVFGLDECGELSSFFDQILQRTAGSPTELQY